MTCVKRGVTGVPPETTKVLSGCKATKFRKSRDEIRIVLRSQEMKLE